MNKLNKPLFFAVCIALLGSSLSANDFGLVLDVSPSYESAEGFDNPGTEKINFSGIIMPWFSAPLGDNAELYLSAGALVKYENEEFIVAPEIYHTEFSYTFRPRQVLRAGRLQYADPLGFIAEGLFDGVSWETPAGPGMLTLGAYYTGLLYKTSANITISEEELASYYTQLDYGDFWDTYFAPRRALGSLGYSILAGETVRLNFALLGQLDLNGRESSYSSEYLVAKVTVPYKSLFVFEAGGTGELIQTTGESILFSLAGLLRFSWMPPGVIQDRVSLGGKYASGKRGDSSLVEFRPLTTEAEGHVLRAKITGLTIIDAAYTARLHRTFSLDLSAAYFIRNDLTSYQGIFADNDEYFMGGEAFAQLIWNPIADMRLILGGGAFMPQLGNTSPDSKPMWLISLNLLMALL
jgi:hypothetical protein